VESARGGRGVGLEHEHLLRPAAVDLYVRGADYARGILDLSRISPRPGTLGAVAEKRGLRTIQGVSREASLAPRLAGARVRRPPARGRGRRGAELGLDRTSAEVELFDADLVVDVVLRPAARRQIHALANEQRPRAAHDRLLGNRHLGRARG